MSRRAVVLEKTFDSVRKLWNEWDLRAIILISLSIQLFLCLFGNHRKYISKSWIRNLIWAAYTVADPVAIYALGLFSKNCREIVNTGGTVTDCTTAMENPLKSLWAQFLLLHLGGPDTITAFALEDNELWKRSIAELLLQTGGAIYVIILAWSSADPRLSTIASLMLVVGLIKYIERISVLRCSSSDVYRKSMLGFDSERWPVSCLSFGEEEERNRRPSLVISQGKSSSESASDRNNRTQGYEIKKAEGYILGVEKNPTMSGIYVDLPGSDKNIPSEKVKFLSAKIMFEIILRVFLGAPMSLLDKEIIQRFIRNLSSEDAFEIIEMQLGVIYDSRFTKVPIFNSSFGFLLRVITLIFTSFPLVLFSISFHHYKDKYPNFDVGITLALVVVACFVEIYGTIILFSSEWFYFKHRKISTAVRALTTFWPLRIPRWTNAISQYTVLSSTGKESKISVFGLKLWTRRSRHWNIGISKGLKKKIFTHFEQKSDDYMKTWKNPFSKPPLAPVKYDESARDKNINWEEYEFKILFWSIATDIIYSIETVQNQQKYKFVVEISRYMMYLLVKEPLLISAEVGLMGVNFEHIIQLAKKAGNADDDPIEAHRTLLNDLSPVFRGEENDNDVIVLREALECALSAFGWGTVKWEKVEEFWLDMLGYAAMNSKAEKHMQLLSSGGEFITHLWLLAAEFGFTHHFRVSESCPSRVVAK